jgi:hypothetical protein
VAKIYQNQSEWARGGGRDVGKKSAERLINNKNNKNIFGI